MDTLKYYVETGTYVIFNKYTIDTSGVIRNKKTGRAVKTRKNKDDYNVCGVYDGYGKQQCILIGRALASTFHGKPLTPSHTADHIDRDRDNDILTNIRWATKRVQQANRMMPENQKNAFIIVKDGNEKTVKEWVEHLKDEKNSFGRNYTKSMIEQYAQRSKCGFSYKKYPNLQGEVWRKINTTKINQGNWEISNMCRVKFITKYAENVLSGERIGLKSGYPSVSIGKCHILAFMTFFPDEWAAKKPEEIVKHIGDDKLDFRPHKLQIGTQSENAAESHDNGKHDGTKSERMKCASYINGVLEKQHVSQSAAGEYLKSVGYEKADNRSIGQALKAFRNGKVIMRYGRTWSS